jgi:hypothetical protein
MADEPKPLETLDTPPVAAPFENVSNLQSMSRLQARIDELQAQLQIQNLEAQIAAGQGGPGSFKSDKQTASHYLTCKNCEYEFHYPVPTKHDPLTYVQEATGGCPACSSKVGFDVVTHETLKKFAGSARASKVAHVIA